MAGRAADDCNTSSNNADSLLRKAASSGTTIAMLACEFSANCALAHATAARHSAS